MKRIGFAFNPTSSAAVESMTRSESGNPGSETGLDPVATIAWPKARLRVSPDTVSISSLLASVNRARPCT